MKKLSEDRKFPRLSVIIPVYEVEDCLKICLDSILGQSYKTLEIILVDDGSKDNSGVICENYAAQDYRIKVIHQKNAGLAAARNTGLQYATGDFISFVDSDDYLNCMAYEKLVAYIDNQVCDICCFGHFRVRNGKAVPYDVPPEKQMYCGQAENIGILFSNALSGKPGKGRCFTGISAWSALYNRTFIEKNGLQFESEREILSEDIVFNMGAYACARNVMVYPDYLYYYVLRKQSLTRTYRRDRFQAALRMDSRLQEIVGKYQLQQVGALGLSKAFSMNLIVCLKQAIRFAKKNGHRHIIQEIKYMGTHERTKMFLRENDHADGLQQKVLFWCLRSKLWHLAAVILKSKTYLEKE